MTRTFFDHKKQSHTLDLDAMLVDNSPCISVQVTEQNVQFETAQGAVTCGLGQFWHEVAGPDLNAQEAGLLLAECLMRQVIIQRTSAALHEVMCLLTGAMALPAEIPSFGWLTTRLDPLVQKAMVAYDGTPEMTAMLARILQCEPATIKAWAHQLGLDMSLAPAQSEAGVAALPEKETFSLVIPAPVEAESSPVAAIAKTGKQFRWTPEHYQQLEQALPTCTGTTVIERARQIAYEHNWPIMAVRSKLYEMQRPQHRADKRAAREPESTGAAKEEDRHADQCEAVLV